MRTSIAFSNDRNSFSWLLISFAKPHRHHRRLKNLTRPELKKDTAGMLDFTGMKHFRHRYGSYPLTTRQVLCPPNPNVLLIAALIFRSTALLGT